MSDYQDYGWQHAGSPNGAGGHGLAQLFVSLAQKSGAGLRICDLGSGNGYLAGLLANAGFRVVGVDASEAGTALARANFPQAEFVCQKLGSDLAEVVGNDFDVVVSSDVIEHLYRPSDLAETAMSVLKPQGQAFIGTPYHGYLKNLALAVTGKMDSHFTAEWDGGHVKFFSVKTLGALLTRHGFALTGWSYAGRAPWLWKNMIAHARKRG